MNILKKLGALFAGILVCGVIFGCTNELKIDSESASTISTGCNARGVVASTECTAEIKIYLVGADSSKSWNLWAWKDSENNYGSSTWKSWAYSFKTDSVDNRALSCTLNVIPSTDFNFLFVSSDGGKQTGDIKIIGSEIDTGGKTFYYVYGESEPKANLEDCFGLKYANIIEKNGSKVKVYILTGGETVTKEDFTVKNSEDTALTISKCESENNYVTLTITGGDIAKRPYSVKYGEDTVFANVTSDLIDEVFTEYTGGDLGLTLNGNSATFKTYAPTASDVKLLLYSSIENIGEHDSTNGQVGATTSIKMKGTPDLTQNMELLNNENGVWSLTDVDISSYKYYKYQITVNSETFYVCDIWHTVASGDSVASQIISIDDSTAKPDGWENWEDWKNNTNKWKGTDYTDAVIYEMHIRDWSRAFVETSTGKFKDITNNLGESGDFAKHLKDLGVTHVQILPMFDYSQTNDNEKYNWGYNPYNYNVPEGRYVTKGYTDGTQAVKEMREMIQAFHDIGIGVIMDVVYNHTSGTKAWSLYDSTVPEYFYRVKDGSYSNGSGCGNETATNHKMVKRFVINSLLHWMKDYHLDGFRFDLMGVHEASTMKDIYDALYAENPNVIVYGEPWRGDGEKPTDAAFSATKGTSGMGAGAFDDDFRDAVKGGEFDGFQKGQVQGTFNDSTIITGLKGELISKNKRNNTGVAGLALHYAECHDNFTLFDKLAMSELGMTKPDETKLDLANELGDSLAKIKEEQKLAGAYILLSQGTPFINGGQEFCRTKKGSPDSYAADKKGIEWTDDAGPTNIDDVNTIDLSFKDSNKYGDVYKTYKGLIHLRRDYKAFRQASQAKAEKLKNGITKYVVSADDDEFTVIFNATDKEFTIFGVTGTVAGIGINDTNADFGINGQLVKVGDDSEKGYTIATEKSATTKVSAHGFIVVKTK